MNEIIKSKSAKVANSKSLKKLQQTFLNSLWVKKRSIIIAIYSTDPFLKWVLFLNLNLFFKTGLVF